MNVDDMQFSLVRSSQSAGVANNVLRLIRKINCAENTLRKRHWQLWQIDVSEGANGRSFKSDRQCCLNPLDNLSFFCRSLVNPKKTASGFGDGLGPFDNQVSKPASRRLSQVFT